MSCVRDGFRPLLLALPVLSLIAQPLPAQDEGPVPEKVFEERIGVEIVNVDVVVTDKKGRPVEGLTREDFELRIDGQEVPIANFYAVTGDAASSEETGAAVATADEIAPAPVSRPAREPLHVVVYLDSFYLTPHSRKKVLRDLPGFVEQQLAAGARIMVVARHQSIQALTLFTTDREELLAAIEKAEDLPSAGLQQARARLAAYDNIQTIYEGCDGAKGVEGVSLQACDVCFEQMVEMARIYSLSVINERRGAMAALGSVANALSVLEGRKAFVHVSDGIQQQAGLDMFHYIGDKLCPHRRGDLQQYVLGVDVYDLSELVSRANASRVTIYALEAAGMRNFSGASTEHGSYFFTPSGENDMVRIGNLQSSLFYLANETGGKAILNASRFAPDLAKLTAEIGTYYSLGYQPQHQGGGRTHRVAVKVPKRNHQVRHRRTFLHKKPDQQLADKALGAVMFGVEENPLGVEVRPGSQSSGSEGRVVVPLEVSVPLEKLSFIPRDGLRQGRLKVIVAAPDEKGRKTVVRHKEVAVELAGNAGEQEGLYRFGVNVELAPGEYRLGVGVWDEVAADGSFVGLRVEAQPGLAEMAASDQR